MAEETQTNPDIDLVSLEQQALTVRQEMRAIQIHDQDSYNLAVEKRTQATDWLKRAAEFFDGPIKSAHELHKKLLTQKKTVCEPVESTIRQINSALVQFDHEQECKRREGQRRIEEEARRQAEEQRIADAEHMVSQGIPEEEALAAVVEAPVAVAAPVVAPTYEKSKQVQFRDNWQAEIVDLHKFVKAVAKDKSKLPLLVGIQRNPDGRFLPGPPLNQLAKAMRETLEESCPGIVARNARVVASGRG